jgi:predicted nucleic acid-binding Zn ribbon protein
METFIKVLPAVIEAAGASEEVLEAACLGAWKHAVGETLSARAMAESLRDQTLVVAVEDKVWQRQLEQMRDQFLFRLNKVLGRRVVQGIEFRIAPEKFAVQKPVAEKSATRSVPIELISAAASIEDPGLRKAFLGAAVSCVNRLEKQHANQRS